MDSLRGVRAGGDAGKAPEANKTYVIPALRKKPAAKAKPTASLFMLADATQTMPGELLLDPRNLPCLWALLEMCRPIPLLQVLLSPLIGQQ